MRGTDNQLCHNWFDGARQRWEPLGGVLTSAPRASSCLPGQLDVYARGAGGVWAGQPAATCPQVFMQAATDGAGWWAEMGPVV